MLAARITVVIIAILGVIIARNPDSSVFGIVSFAWAGFGAGFGPLVIRSLFWKCTTLPGAIAGMVAGGAMVFIWKYLVKPLDGVFGVYELLPAFLVGLLVIVIVSLCTKAPARDVMDEFERARSNEILLAPHQPIPPISHPPVPRCATRRSGDFPAFSIDDPPHFSYTSTKLAHRPRRRQCHFKTAAFRF
ncbi:MAG: hypothetical protein V8S89_06740 [Oscillospiraceae bacterium]